MSSIVQHWTAYTLEGTKQTLAGAKQTLAGLKILETFLEMPKARDYPNGS